MCSLNKLVFGVNKPIYIYCCRILVFRALVTQYKKNCEYRKDNITAGVTFSAPAARNC